MTDNRSALTQWAGAALGLPEVQVQVRLRGNHLHILCEAVECPPQSIVVAQYSEALSVTDLEKLVPRNLPRIYQVFLCGRRLGARQNNWTVKLECNSPNRNQQPLKRQEAQPLVTPPPASPTGSKEVRNLGKSKLEREISQPHNAPNQASNAIAVPGEVRISTDNVPIAAQSQENEVFATSPLTIDTASTSRLSAASVPLHPLSYPMTAGQITQQSTATLEVPSEESNSTQDEGTLTISCERLARRGYPDAIASYLSEILGALGVSVKVSIREQGSEGALERGSEGAGENSVSSPLLLVRRLWVLCESAYSPDPSLLAEPIAQRLRDLKLEDFRDAVICSQVRGEAKPDWMLRVDLTPPSQMLKEWARWGDVAAIARLLNEELVTFGIEVRATLKEFTLHLFCNNALGERGSRGAGAQGSGGAGETERQRSFSVPSSSTPDKQVVREAIAPILAAIAPQGIRGATVYGVEAPRSQGEETPVWIDWLDLPAAHHPDLAVSAVTLATQGDRSALTFLINRLLNPNLDRKLQTGGIRALILPKGDLLHIMSESPTCPSQSKVGPPIAQFLRQLKIPGIVGVRVYGRRAGQKLPLWRYGVEVSTAVPEVSPVAPAKPLSKIARPSFDRDIVPEFAPSAADMAFTGLEGDLVLSPDFPGTTVRPDERIRSRPRKLGQGLLGLQRSLISSGLFVPNDALSTTVANSNDGWRDRRTAIALVWAAAGCLLAFQTDSLLGKFLESFASNNTTTQVEERGSRGAGELLSRGNLEQGSITDSFHSKPLTVARREALPGKKQTEASSQNGSALGVQQSNLSNPETREVSLPQLPLQQSPQSNSTEVFNGSGFTKPGTASVEISANNNSQESFSTSDSVENYPTFRSDQLDEQLVRYQKYIRTHKRLPDIMIVGSSRALRGVEPTVLEKALAEQGYPGLKVYNFGVNGATVQVVDLILRRVLPVEQLPKLIVLADGARAVNSGRIDVTYNAIATSEGYRQLAQGTWKIHTNRLAQATSKSAAPVPLSPIAEFVQNIDNRGVAIEEFLNHRLERVSGTYRNRDRLKSFLRSLIISQQQPALVPNKEPQIAKQNLIVDSGQKSEFDSNGFLPIDLRFEPATYYQQHSKVSGDYDADYQSFQLVGRQTDAIKNLAEFTKAHNVNLVFVNMPLTKDYLDPVRGEYEQEFRQQMQQLAAETGLIFRDIGLLWPEARENFSDPSHLNRYGAVEVSKHLAQDPMIPWPTRN
ncbi:DUF1574 family protein [Kamptonema sp. UHCC 0994]|uniref:DUF1574 family protein n=1 Tax=Kamptonema sp. UHCC 0994 TaxID=3031329 RepID=UPI0023BA24B3|nr:DUF1574 family protein [Kamptonema sp. UHCC 0994]MDF0554957.1 DUF1574 family protein [Kamptonema sp. UHCC 0994]